MCSHCATYRKKRKHESKTLIMLNLIKHSLNFRKLLCLTTLKESQKTWIESQKTMTESQKKHDRISENHDQRITNKQKFRNEQ